MRRYTYLLWRRPPDTYVSSDAFASRVTRQLEGAFR